MNKTLSPFDMNNMTQKNLAKKLNKNIKRIYFIFFYLLFITDLDDFVRVFNTILYEWSHQSNEPVIHN